MLHPLLLVLLVLTSQALTSDIEENSRENKSLRVRIGNSTTKAVLSGTLTIPCHVTYLSSPEDVTVGRRAVLATPRVKWTFISNGKEEEILVARGRKIKISEGYGYRVSLPHYSSSAHDVTLVLRELISNDSGIYCCHVQHGIEDDHDMLEVKVKGVVFLYREGTTRYAYTFPKAQEACARIKAHIATADQLLAAYRGGYEQCDAGWIADQTVRYPIQIPREGCYGDMDGFPGVRNYGVLDPEDLYDVYCYVDELDGEVFLGSSPEKFTLQEARAYCRSIGSDMATTGQLYAAWNGGLDHCSPGWLSDGSVRYPIVTPRERCGGNSPGVKTIFQFRNQTGFPDSQAKYDVYCFRGKSLMATQKPVASLPTLVDRVQSVITVTESFEELKLPEIKSENEAQGLVDTIPLNQTDVPKLIATDMETLTTAKDQQKLPPQATTPTAVESAFSDEDLSPAFASFPPYEETSDDSEESTTVDTTTRSLLGTSQEDKLGLVPENTPTEESFEDQVPSTTSDTILDHTFVNVNGENHYENFTDSDLEVVSSSESSRPIPSALDVNSSTETTQVYVQDKMKTDIGSTLVPTLFYSVSETDIDVNDINKTLAEVHDHHIANTSMDIIFSTVRPVTESNYFESSGHEDHSMPTEQKQSPKTIGDLKYSHSLDSIRVHTTPMVVSSEQKYQDNLKLSWEDGSGEIPEVSRVTYSTDSIAEINNTNTYETNTTEHQAAIPTLENLYGSSETSTAQVSHLISPDVSPDISTIRNMRVKQKTKSFPTSVLSTVESVQDIESNTVLTPVYTSTPSLLNNPENSTSHQVEKTFQPTLSLSPTESLPAVPTEKAIVGSSMNFSDDCYPNPCDNGGTCIEEDGSDFRCLCLPGYFGKACDINVEQCPEDWDSFQGFCYKHFYTRKSWEEAETHCRHYGSHLISIVTPEEQEFVNNKYREYQWTGLNDRTIEGDFQWSDGNPLLYENWNNGQPDSYFLSGEDCVVMGWHEGGQWSDVPCNYHLPYTCKMGLVFCGSPPEVSNASTYGRPKTRYQISSVVGYRCDDGFVQRNSPIIKCQSDGIWEEPQISCLPALQ